MNTSNSETNEYWRSGEIFAYVRKSLVLGEEDRISEVKQRDSIASECERLGLPEPQWYSDVDGHRSGRYEHTRPGWRACKSRFLASPRSVLVVYELDRSNRNVQAMAGLIERLRVAPERHRMVMVMNRYDSARDGYGAREVRDLLAESVSAQYESDKASERMAATIATLKRHKLPWGQPAYGFDRVGSGMKSRLNPAPFAEQVRFIFREWVAGATFRAIVQRLNSEGHHYHKSRMTGRASYRSPEPWTYARVATLPEMVMLYAGYVSTEKGATVKHDVKDCDPETILADHARRYRYTRTDAVTSIIDDDMCAQVLRTRMAWAQRNSSGHMPKVPLLSGCAQHLGQRMRSQTMRGKRVYRTRCVGSVVIDAETVEKDFLGHMAGIRFPIGVVSGIRAALEELVPSKRDRTKAQTSIQKYTRGLAQAERRYTLGEIDRATYNALRGDFSQSILEAEKLLRQPSSADRAIDALEQVGEVLAAAPPIVRQRAVTALFERVQISREGRVVELVPRPWAREAFGLLSNAWERYQAHEERPLNRGVVTDDDHIAAESIQWVIDRLRPVVVPK